MEMTAGLKLRRLREEIDKSIEIVAKEVGISYQALQAYETDARIPRDHVKVKLAKYYKTSVGSIFFNEQ